MSKIIKIESCKACPHCNNNRLDTNEGYCQLSSRHVDNIIQIAGFCTLENGIPTPKYKVGDTVYVPLIINDVEEDKICFAWFDFTQKKIMYGLLKQPQLCYEFQLHSSRSTAETEAEKMANGYN